MIPATLIVLGLVAILLGTVQAGFSALMPLSERLLAERNAGAGRLGHYLDNPVHLFTPLRLLLAIVNILAALSWVTLIGLERPYHAGIVIASATLFAALCEQIIPGLIVRRRPEGALRVLLPWIEPVVRLMWPPFSLVARGERTGEAEPGPVSQNGPPGEATDAYLDAGEQQGIIERDERKLLQSVVEFSDTLVHEVMTPRPDICAIRADATLDDVRTLFREQGYSRIPVYTDSLDNILGFVFVKDLIRLPALQPASTPLTDLKTTPTTSLIRSAQVVPETKKVSELLREFQRSRIQIAIVVDEYGGTAGLVTAEDLIEELVGEIRDEDDEEVDAIIEEAGGSFVLSGRADIEKAAESLGVEIEGGGFETVGGYVLSRLGRVPAAGEVFEVDGLSLEVIDAERRRVRKVRARRLPRPAEEGPPAIPAVARTGDPS